MPGLLVVARLLLAVTFGVAAVAKGADLAGSRRALRDFGVPRAVVPVAGVLLPVAELVAGSALVLPASARAGAAGALVLLLLFVAGIVLALSRGLTPDCHCFGRLHSSQVGGGTLARNALLAVTAGFVTVAGPGPGVTDWVGSLSSLERPALLAATAAAAVLFAVRARDGRTNARPGARDDLPDRSAAAAVALGDPAPEFEIGGSERVPSTTLSALRGRGLPVLVVFSSSTCSPCQALAPELARWRDQHSVRLTVAVVEDDPIVSRKYGSSGTPTAVLVDADGRIASPLAPGGVAIAHLVDAAVSVTSSVGPPAPERPAPVSRRVVTRVAALVGALVVARPAAASASASGRKPKPCHGARCGSRCCPAGEVCERHHKHGKVHHKCACPTGKVRCHGQCLSTTADPANCGACGHTCQPGEVCQRGTCTPVAQPCPTGQVPCGSDCVDLSSDHGNCGSCGHACTARGTCVDGVCQCQAATCADTGRCSGVIDDGCGGTIACSPTTCGDDQVCFQSYCCTPDLSGMAAYCMTHPGGQYDDNCGQVHNCNGGGGGGG